MKNNRIYQFIQDMSYVDRARLVIKIAKMRKLGKRSIHLKYSIYFENNLLTIGGDLLYSILFDYVGVCHICRLNLHYDPNVMKLEDIGYMLQKNNRRYLWT